MIINDWNEDTGIAQCIITDMSNGTELKGYGMAACHDYDTEFKSERTGLFIAQTRAQIDILRKKRDFDLKPGLMALKHLEATMKHSSQFAPKSYENKRLRKEIKNRQKEIDEINDYILNAKMMLQDYITKKDKIYREAENK